MCAAATTSTTTAQAGLVWQLIRDFLSGKGFDLDELHMMPEENKKELMTSACIHASLRLAEIESRSRFVEKIRIKG